ncbi:hypothetical protein [Acinetobacter sp. ANC 4862]|uniref:pilus assembly PilX family protein n=1 Tax=Acinetobacter sp. ANC 4862 TaxID=2529849 RepID=UPI001BC87DBC|nr:hypothetical protein [Acinetobacter sp. ANC 4862]
MKKQQGSVLIITVVVLFAATMISLYAMRGTIIQDKMTANINNKVITTNTAEDGATQFLNWFGGRFKTGGSGWPSSEQSTVWQGKITDNLMPYTNPENGVDADNVQNGRYYWINPKSTIAGCSTVETNPCWDNDNHQVTVQITGNLIKGTGKDIKVLGESIYQVKLAAPNALRLPDLPAALTLAGNVASGKYEANSNNFAIDGKNKLAIATMNSDSNASVIEAIKATNSGNGNGNGNGNGGGKNKESDYTGGSECPSSGACVKNANLGLWGDANEVMKLVKSIVPSYPTPPSTPIPNVTYIQGDVSKIPACTGIIIIKGDVTDGKTDCGEIRGIVLILGGLYHIQGGGNTVINGALYVANIEADGAGYKFGDTQFTVNGGGNMEIKYNSELMNTGTGTGTGLGYTSGISVLSWNEVNPENIE